MRLGAGTFGQLTLWGGASPIVLRLMDYFIAERWPKGTHFRWAVSDRMADAEWYLYLIPTAAQLISMGHTVELWRTAGCHTYENTNPDKHRHIAKLYRDAFARAAVDDWCLSIEDDNLPPVGALEHLASHAAPDIAQIGGVYRIRGAPHLINASTSLADVWTPPQADSIPSGLFRTPMMGAGYTLYQGAALRRMPPVQCRVTPPGGGYGSHVAGWDDHVGRYFAAQGYRSLSDGGLWIEHHTPEVLAYLKTHNLSR